MLSGVVGVINFSEVIQFFDHNKSSSIFILYSKGLLVMVVLLFILHSPNTPFIKSGMRFYKNGCNGKGGRGGTFVLEMSRGSQEWGLGFIMGGSIWEIFSFSLHNCGEVLTPLFYEDPLILPIHPAPPPYFFSNFVQPPPPQISCHIQLHRNCFFLFSCFFG